MIKQVEAERLLTEFIDTSEIIATTIPGQAASTNEILNAQTGLSNSTGNSATISQLKRLQRDLRGLPPTLTEFNDNKKIRFDDEAEQPANKKMKFDDETEQPANKKMKFDDEMVNEVTVDETLNGSFNETKDYLDEEQNDSNEELEEEKSDKKHKSKKDKKEKKEKKERKEKKEKKDKKDKKDKKEKKDKKKVETD